MELVKIDQNVALMEEWYRFIKYGKKLSSPKKNVINSWERSKELKIDPFSGKSNIILSLDDLNKKISKNKKLIDITRPFVDKIYKIIKGLGYIVFLTDEEANLLHIIGDENVQKDFKEKLNFIIGAAWSETAVGTTAV